ncbi:MAG TPA: hypothetical protein VK771_09500 [Acidimicrobiia bacterium]|nr:hypothetical protein [Acidimicrobiia bacterium]
MSFYDEVLRELVLALGGALFLANGAALLRRRGDARRAAAGTAGGRRPSGTSRGNGTDDLVQAPLARTVTYLVVGLVVATWALASIVTR